jgi:hypothetical protein
MPDPRKNHFPFAIVDFLFFISPIWESPELNSKSPTRKTKMKNGKSTMANGK